MPKICIIGAGITGLATAWQLKEAGHDITVLESARTVGGAMRSVQRDGYLAEEGPNSIQLNSAEIEAFFNSIPGLSEQIIEAEPAANKRYIVRGGKPHAVPMNPLQAITTPLWSFGAKLRVLKEPFIPARQDDREESVADFVRRRLGPELYDYAINPLVGGIYAGDPEKLSLRYGFPKLYALEQEHGGLIRGAIAKMRAAKKSTGPKFRKRILSFKNGIDSLPRTIARNLGNAVQCAVSISSIQKDGAHWELHWNGEQSKRFDQLIVTTPAHALHNLPFESALKTELTALQSIDYPPVSVLSLGFKKSDIAHPLDGFGALVPECEQRKILGALFPSSVFSGRAPDGEALFTVFIGGERQPDCATDDTERLLSTVLPELEALLGVTGKPTFVHHKHWPQAIPQYKLGYGTTLET
ncbi:MAG: protoporphyrinogen oxidase, partial [Coraliomargarita sp.]